MEFRFVFCISGCVHSMQKNKKFKKIYVIFVHMQNEKFINTKLVEEIVQNNIVTCVYVLCVHIYEDPV